MTRNESLRQILHSHLSDAMSGWSMGSFGALAEFIYDNNEPILIEDENALTLATRRGAIHLNVEAIDRAFACETTVKDKSRWSHGFALCVDIKNAEMGNRNVLTQLGPDSHAICAKNKDDILFDMGLGAIGSGCGHVEFCIRTNNDELIRLLNDHEEKSIADPSSSAMPAILKAHPHRVAITPIGRIEVYQPIGGPDTDDKSPEGPPHPRLAKSDKSQPHPFSEYPNSSRLNSLCLSASGQPCYNLSGWRNVF